MPDSQESDLGECCQGANNFAAQLAGPVAETLMGGRCWWRAHRSRCRKLWMLLSPPRRCAACPACSRLEGAA